MKRSRSFRHYSSAPTTQWQSLVGLTELKAPWGRCLGLSGHPSGPCPLFVCLRPSYVADVLAQDGSAVSWNPNFSAPHGMPMLYFEVRPRVASALSGSANQNGAACVTGSAIGPG